MSRLTTFVLALLLASVFYLYARYANAVVPIEDVERTLLTKKAYRDFYQALFILNHCSYLKATFPDEFSSFIQRASETKITIANIPIDGICGAAPFGYKTIYIFPEAWKDHSGGCYLDDSRRLLAHEFLHILGLPTHKRYRNERDYERLDPIEQVISVCFEKEPIVKAIT